jgi:hypothetical protein
MQEKKETQREPGPARGGQAKEESSEAPRKRATVGRGYTTPLFSKKSSQLAENKQNEAQKRAKREKERHQESGKARRKRPKLALG